MKVLLENRALLRVSGDDALTFLQSQFTNDVFQLTSNKIQINAYCQHQGKILALLWVFTDNKDYFLSLPDDLKEPVLSKLNMFKLMSRVQIEDYSSEYNQYGLIDEQYQGSFSIKNNLSFLATKEKLDTKINMQHWEIACIDNNLPEIYQNTSEQFIPQALNLDIDEIGVSFTKGCYPGQEVVARMHYLGKPKRRLFHFFSKCETIIGDLINVNGSNSLKSSGVILRVVKVDENYHSLGIFEMQHVNEPAYLNNDINKSLTIFNA